MLLNYTQCAARYSLQIENISVDQGFISENELFRDDHHGVIQTGGMVMIQVLRSLYRGVNPKCIGFAAPRSLFVGNTTPATPAPLPLLR